MEHYTQCCPCSLVPIKNILLEFEVYLLSSKSVLCQKIPVFEQLKSPLQKIVWPLKVFKFSVHIFRGPWLTYPRQGESFTKHLNEVCNEPKSMAKTKCHHNENRSPGKSRWSKSLYIVRCQNISIHFLKSFLLQWQSLKGRDLQLIL